MAPIDDPAPGVSVREQPRAVPVAAEVRPGAAAEREYREPVDGPSAYDRRAVTEPRQSEVSYGPARQAEGSRYEERGDEADVRAGGVYAATDDAFRETGVARGGMEARQAEPVGGRSIGSLLRYLRMMQSLGMIEPQIQRLVRTGLSRDAAEDAVIARILKRENMDPADVDRVIARHRLGRRSDRG